MPVTLQSGELDAEADPKQHARRSGMTFISGATFRMGSDRHYPEEAPVHRVRSTFWMDATPVTNAFGAFVDATATSPSPKSRPTRRTIRAPCRIC